MRNEDRVRVLVVDDHVGIRFGITCLIDAEKPRMCCVGTAGTALEALERTRELQPHVVVLDVDLDGVNGLALIPRLHLAAACSVVVLTSLADEHVAAHALHQGAHAFLHKTAPAAELVAAIFEARSARHRFPVATRSNAGEICPMPPGTNHPWPAGTSADVPEQGAA